MIERLTHEPTHAFRHVRIHVYHERAEVIRAAVLAAAPDREVIALASREALAAAMPAIEVLFAPDPPRAGWAGAARLRLIQLLGAGVDQLLPSPDLPAQVEVAGVRGVFAAEVAEHAIAMILALRKRLPELLDDQRARRWRQRPRGSVAGEAVTVVGAGEIGGRVARLCEALGMRVTVVSRTRGDLAAALDGARYLVVTAPLTPGTANLIDAAALARLPAGAFVIGVGRGGVIDEAALDAALRSGRLGGAALDVFVDEPLPPEHPLWTAPGMIATSHVAGYGERYVERCVQVLLENVAALEAGAPRRGLVDRAAGY